MISCIGHYMLIAIIITYLFSGGVNLLSSHSYEPKYIPEAGISL